MAKKKAKKAQPKKKTKKKKVTSKITKKKKQMNTNLIGMAVIIIVLAVIIIFGTSGSDTATEPVPETCDPPNILHNGRCCMDANLNGLCDSDERGDTQNGGSDSAGPVITLGQNDIVIETSIFEWSLGQRNSCQRCADAPHLFDCTGIVKPLLYSCDNPDEDSRIDCITTVTGDTYNEEATRICHTDDIASNQIFVRLDQTNNVRLCCQVVDFDGTPKSNEICKTAVIEPPCEI